MALITPFSSSVTRVNTARRRSVVQRYNKPEVEAKCAAQFYRRPNANFTADPTPIYRQTRPVHRQP